MQLTNLLCSEKPDAPDDKHWPVVEILILQKHSIYWLLLPLPDKMLETYMSVTNPSVGGMFASPFKIEAGVY